MNTKIYHSLYALFVAGALLASGCSNDDDTYDFYAAHPDAVRFHITAGDMPQTRVNTESDGSSFESADLIAISADGGTSYSNYILRNEWLPAEGQHYLRWKEEELSFQAYYPVTPGTDYTHFTVPTSQSDESNLRAADYMTASAADQSSANPVKLTFKHQLAKVTITSITLAEEVKDKQLNQVTFHTKGNVLENGRITNGHEDVRYYSFQSGNSYMAILPPQSGNSSAAFIKVLLNNTNYPLTGIPALEAGKAYTLALQVGHDGVKLVRDITVEEWGNQVDMDKGTATLKPEPYQWYLKDKSAGTFTLANATELREFAKLVNGDQEALAATGESSGYDFYQKTVQIADTVTKELDLSDAEWTPIGTTTKLFNGTFNGNGKTVSGVTINIASGSNVGFFTQLANGRLVKNLRVKGNVTAETSSFVGGIVGNLLNGTIEHCAFQGTVKGNASVGGIVGYNQSGSITACFASGSVEATNSKAGGIVGTNYKTLTHCYSRAEVTAKGTAKGTDVGDTGGIAGVNDNSSGNTGAISHCYATGKITANTRAGGIVGKNNPGSVISNCIALNAEIAGSTGNQYFGRVAGTNYGTLTGNAAWNGMTLPGGISATDNAIGTHGKSLTATECLSKTTYTTYGFDENEWAFSDKPTWDYLPWNKTLYQYWGTEVCIDVPSYLK